MDHIAEASHPLRQSDGVGEKTWSLPLQYRGLPPITVTPYELFALYLALNHVTYLDGTPFVDALRNVIAKVEDALPARTVNHVDRIHQVFIPLQAPLRSYRSSRQVLTAVQKALLLQRVTRLLHTVPGYDEAIEHEVEPHALLLINTGSTSPGIHVVQTLYACSLWSASPRLR